MARMKLKTYTCMITFFFLHICSVLSNTSILANANKPREPQHPPQDPLFSNCADDIEDYCLKNGNQGHLFIMYCLEQHKSDLTETCRTYLSTTAYGGMYEQRFLMKYEFLRSFVLIMLIMP